MKVTKTCTMCLQDLEFIHFSKKISHADGLRPRCRSCEKLRRIQLRTDTIYDALRVRRRTRFEKTQLLKVGAPNPSGTRTCRSCWTNFPLERFGKNIDLAEGRNYECKGCAVKRTTAYYADPQFGVTRREAKALNRRQGYLADPGKKHHRNRTTTLLKYKLTMDDYTALLDKQNGACSICGGPPTQTSFCVDHDHVTGAVRGLLCKPCNTAIGNLKDDAELVRKALKYLEGPCA